MKSSSNSLVSNDADTDPEFVPKKKVIDSELKLKTKAGMFKGGQLDKGTKLLLDHLETPEDRSLIADLGTGSGIIGMTLAKRNPRAHVHLLDDHLRVVELAEQNVELNNLKNVEVYISDLFSAVGPQRNYHLIVSNPPQHLGNQFLEEVTAECFKHLKKGGKLYWVLQQHLKPVGERLFESYFKNCRLVTRGLGYVVLSAEREK